MKGLMVVVFMGAAIIGGGLVWMNHCVNSDVQHAQDWTYTAPVELPRCGTLTGLTVVSQGSSYDC